MTAGILALELMIMIAVGYFIEKRNLVSKQFNKDLASFITNISLPCMIVNSMQVEFSLEELKNCGFLLVAAAGFLAVSFAAGGIAWHFSPRDYRGRILRFGLVFTNFTFMGIPVIEALYGSQGVFHFVIFLVPLRIALYTLAKPLLSPSHTVPDGEKRKPFGWLTPPLAAVPVGLLLYITGWKLPGVVGQVVNWIASVCSPLGMILCGVTLAKYPFRSLLQKRCLFVALLRVLVMPALMLALCCLLKLDATLTRPVVICAALPMASMTVTFTTRYDPDVKSHFDSAGCVLFSTILSAASIPLWAWLLSVAAG